jgi:flagellar hook assembly protein FlgD
VAIQGANGVSYTPTAEGIYTVQISNTCGNATSDPVSWSITSIQTIDPSLGFRVYPNPYKGQTNIYYQLTQLSNVKLEVYNMVGQLVHTIVNEKQSAGKYNYEFSAVKLNMTAGSYLVKLSVNDKIYSAQIIELK